MFFVLPSTVLGLSLAGPAALLAALITAAAIAFIVGFVNLMQNFAPHFLPKFMRNWHFLPECLRSLRPLDRLISRLTCFGLNNSRENYGGITIKVTS